MTPDLLTEESPMSIDVPAIEAEHIDKWFGPTHALEDVSFTIPRGDRRALVGRNGAGKSTLVSLITGLDRADGGHIRIGGVELDGQDDRIACVYQRSSLIPALTVAENILLRHYPRRSSRMISWTRLRREAQLHLDAWGIAHLVDEPSERLEPIHRKVVEICRALVGEPEVLILDEPTAGLDKREAERLFMFIDRLSDKGVTIIYISHHLDEIYRVCTSATVLRDARHIVTAELSELPMPDLVHAMVGEEPPSAAVGHRAERAMAQRKTLLRVRNVRAGTSVGPIDLDLSAGECLGIAGLEGSGKVSFARSLAGLEARTGEVILQDRSVPVNNVRAAIDAGIGFTPEDRHFDGLVSCLDVSENATMTAAAQLARRISRLIPAVSLMADRDRAFGTLARQWNIVAASPRQQISELSGGNQQKCVMARALATTPRLLILVNPTAGVDISAKASIVQSLEHILDRGAGVLIVSEDPDDFILCERILVIVKGQIHTSLESGWTETALVSAMQGVKP